MQKELILKFSEKIWFERWNNSFHGNNLRIRENNMEYIKFQSATVDYNTNLINKTNAFKKSIANMFYIK